MEIEITPEPTPEERAALLAAVEGLLEEEQDGPGPWWEAGVRDGIDDEDASSP